MQAIVLCTITSFILAFVLTPVLIEELTRKKVLDVGRGRKIHKGFVPSMGGIVIFAGFIFACLVWIPFSQLSVYRYFFAAVGILFITGVRDDMIPLRSRDKFIIQIISAVIVAWGGGLYGIRITSFYGLFGIEEIPIWLSYVLTVLTIVTITNAFNLIDGIDGLAGSIGLTAIIGVILWSFLIENQNTLDMSTFRLVLLAVLGGVLAFLCYNWHPASIFMGDTGSLFLGFLLAISTIKFMENNYALPMDNPYKLTATITSGIMLVFLPIFDTVRISLLRIRQGKSPFHPDKLHIHHVVFRMGFNHAKVTIILSTFNLLMMATFVYLGRYFSDEYLLLLGILLCIIIDIGLKRIVIRTIHSRKEKILQMPTQSEI